MTLRWQWSGFGIPLEQHFYILPDMILSITENYCEEYGEPSNEQAWGVFAPLYFCEIVLFDILRYSCGVDLKGCAGWHSQPAVTKLHRATNDRRRATSREAPVD